MQRFVVLRHEPGSASDRGLHWDLMLEDESSLRAWALDSEPQAGASISAVELPDHRKEYLDYEGPVSGERGSVTRFDQGTYSIIHESHDELMIELHGEQIPAGAAFRRRNDGQRWLVAFDAP